MVSDEKARQTLTLMGKPADERITSAIGREIAQRTGVKALLVGSIGGMGTQYVVTLDAVNAANSDTLAETQARADSKEQVLKALDQATTQLREKLGESLASIKRFDKPLEEATTSSLEALKAFSLGDEKHTTGNDLAAMPFYKQAIDLDPNFALAYARLGTVYSNYGQLDLAEQNRKKAFELKDRASERERLYITSHYYADSGQLEKGNAAYELYKQTYPREVTPYINLSATALQLGDFEKTLENAKAAIKVDPDESQATRIRLPRIWDSTGWKKRRPLQMQDCACTPTFCPCVTFWPTSLWRRAISPQWSAKKPWPRCNRTWNGASTFATVRSQRRTVSSIKLKIFTRRPARSAKELRSKARKREPFQNVPRSGRSLAIARRRLNPPMPLSQSFRTTTRSCKSPAF